MVTRIDIPTRGPGLVEITAQVADAVRRAGVSEGLCTVFIQHTSASLVIQENADPSAREDLERWLGQLVPPSGAFSHDTEGPDDMPAHIKAALTATSLSVPIVNGTLGLGTWQGIYVWEHRRRGAVRHVLVHVGE